MTKAERRAAELLRRKLEKKAQNQKKGAGPQPSGEAGIDGSDVFRDGNRVCVSHHAFEFVLWSCTSV